MPSLCIKNLTKRYGENVVLNDLSLELENAEVLWLHLMEREKLPFWIVLQI